MYKIQAFKFEDNRGSLIRACCFIGLELRFVRDFAVRLMEYFRRHSDALGAIIEQLIERQDSEESLLPFTESEEIKTDIAVYEGTIRESLKRLKEAIKPGLLGSSWVLGHGPRCQQDPNHIFLRRGDLHDVTSSFYLSRRPWCLASGEISSKEHSAYTSNNLC